MSDSQMSAWLPRLTDALTPRPSSWAQSVIAATTVPLWPTTASGPVLGHHRPEHGGQPVGTVRDALDVRPEEAQAALARDLEDLLVELGPCPTRGRRR